MTHTRSPQVQWLELFSLTQRIDARIIEKVRGRCTGTQRLTAHSRLPLCPPHGPWSSVSCTIFVSTERESRIGVKTRFSPLSEHSSVLRAPCSKLHGSTAPRSNPARVRSRPPAVSGSALHVLTPGPSDPSDHQSRVHSTYLVTLKAII